MPFIKSWLETVHLRMKNTAKMLWNWLNTWRAMKVAYVKYPGLEEIQLPPNLEIFATRCQWNPLFWCQGRCGGRKTFINNIKLASLLVHVGDIRTHVLHPASTTHVN